MRTTTRSWRTLVALAFGTAAVLAVATPGRADAPADSDTFVFEATAGTTTSLGPLPASGTYTLDTTRCFAEPIPVTPSPLPSSAPGYVDIVPDESGACTSITGSGMYTDLVACSTGQITMSWDLTEPSGDIAHVDASGVVVGGVIVAAALPGGYRDDGASIGTAVITGVVLAAPTPVCMGVQELSFTVVVQTIY